MTQADTAQTPQPKRRWREAALGGVLCAMVVAGLAGLAAATGWEETWHHLSALGSAEIALLLALSLVNYLARGLRWHLFTRSLGLQTTLGQDIRHFLGGFAMTVTPGRVGELIRLRWLKRETGRSYDRTAPVVLADRAADLAAMGLILAAALVLSATGMAGAVPVAILAIVGAFAVTRPRLLAALASFGYRLLGRAPRLFGRVRRAARTLGAFSRPRVAVAALTLGVLGWLAEGYALYLLLHWMGAPVPFWTAVAIFTFATLAGGLTGAPGGLGGAEAAMVALLQLQGVPLAISVPATAVIRLTTLWFAIAIGAAVFPFAERRATRAPLSGGQPA